MIELLLSTLAAIMVVTVFWLVLKLIDVYNRPPECFTNAAAPHGTCALCPHYKECQPVTRDVEMLIDRHRPREAAPDELAYKVIR